MVYLRGTRKAFIAVGNLTREAISRLMNMKRAVKKGNLTQIRAFWVAACTFASRSGVHRVLVRTGGMHRSRLSEIHNKHKVYCTKRVFSGVSIPCWLQ